MAVTPSACRRFLQSRASDLLSLSCYARACSVLLLEREPPAAHSQTQRAAVWWCKKTHTAHFLQCCSSNNAVAGSRWFTVSGGSSTLGKRVFAVFVCRSCERRSEFILSQYTLAPCCSSVCFLDKLPSHVLHNCVDTSQWLKPNKQSPEFLLRQRSEDIETRRTKAATATTRRGLLFCTARIFFCW